MELGCGVFTYIPRWKNNRTLPENEQLSVKIHCLRSIDLMGRGYEEEELRAWVTETFPAQMADAQQKCKLERSTPEILTVLREVLEHTSGYRNFRFGGEDVTDAREIFLRIPMPTGIDQSENLLFELRMVLSETANLTEEEVGNYDGPSGGLDMTTAKNATPADQGDGPTNANTTQDLSEASKSEK